MYVDTSFLSPVTRKGEMNSCKVCQAGGGRFPVPCLSQKPIALTLWEILRVLQVLEV